MISFKNIFIAGLVCCATCATIACQKNEYGTVDLSSSGSTKKVDVNYTYDFSSTSGMYSASDYTRVKNALADGSAPSSVQQEYTNLLGSSYVNKNYTATPHVQIVRGDPTGTTEGVQNYTDAMKDAAAAYQMGLLWKIHPTSSEAQAYAATAVKILNDWANTCTEITSNDADFNLAAGAQGYTFALAGTLLMDYDGWSSSDKTIFKSWMSNVFATANRTFLDNHAIGDSFKKSHANVDESLWHEHYWSNWDMVNLASYLAIGILLQDNSMVNYVVNYFYGGSGNGCITKLIRGTHTDPLGSGETICQNQESGRDQGHAEMSMMVCAHLCQIAYNLYTTNTHASELNFFEAQDKAVLHMAEYVALCNLRDGTDNQNANGNWIIANASVPFTEYHHCPGSKSSGDDNTHTQISIDERGKIRPGWEIIVAYYTSDNKYAKQMAEKIRPEGGAGEAANRYGSNSGAFDQIGWNTLMLVK